MRTRPELRAKLLGNFLAAISKKSLSLEEESKYEGVSPPVYSKIKNNAYNRFIHTFTFYVYSTEH